MLTMSAIRRELNFSGRVQGVGFRFTACQIATKYPVTGWVKNLNNGNVQMLVEGLPDEIDRFVGELETAIHTRGLGRIDACQRSGDLPATGNFDSFRVR
jgi:acylphosphatase